MNYSSEEFLTDLMDGFEEYHEVTEIGETFATNNYHANREGHAVSVEIRNGKKFIVHVVEV
jgi:hypothetical protein